jgi:hypothetical protein
MLQKTIDQLSLLSTFHPHDVLRVTAGNLAEALSAYAAKVAEIRDAVMPKYHTREITKARAVVEAELTKFKARVAVETRRAEPKLPQPVLTKSEMAEVRGLVLDSLRLPGKQVVDSVRLMPYLVNKDAAVLHSLLHSPIDVLTPDDTQRVLAALAEQTPAQKEAAAIAEGLSNLVAMSERAIQ